MSYIIVYISLAIYFIIGIICHVLSAREKSRCKHKWEWNNNVEGYWCFKCWSKKDSL